MTSSPPFSTCGEGRRRKIIFKQTFEYELSIVASPLTPGWGIVHGIGALLYDLNFIQQ